jgi:hypothetical protein
MAKILSVQRRLFLAAITIALGLFARVVSSPVWSLGGARRQATHLLVSSRGDMMQVAMRFRRQPVFGRAWLPIPLANLDGVPPDLIVRVANFAPFLRIDVMGGALAMLQDGCNSDGDGDGDGDGSDGDGYCNLYGTCDSCDSCN